MVGHVVKMKFRMTGFPPQRLAQRNPGPVRSLQGDVGYFVGDDGPLIPFRRGLSPVMVSVSMFMVFPQDRPRSQGQEAGKRSRKGDGHGTAGGALPRRRGIFSRSGRAPDGFG